MKKHFLSILLLAGITMNNAFAETLPEFDKLWDYNKPKETEAKFLELLPLAEKSDNRSYYLELLTQIARTQGLQQKFTEAHQTLDQVEKLLTPELAKPRARYLLERGRVFNSSKQPEQAKPFFLQAWETAVAAKEDYLAIDALHMLAIVEPTDKQLEWNLKALKLAEQATDERAKGWVGSLYNNIGWTYHDSKEYTKALELFEKNVKWHEAKQTKQGLIIAKWSVARTLRSLNRVEEALQMQQNLLKELAEKQLEPDGYIPEEIGECLLLLKKPDEAVPYFAKAYELLSQDIWLQKNEKERLERLKKLGTLS